MPQSLARMLVHVIFSTKDRIGFLSDAEMRGEAHRFLGGILNNLDSPVISVGGIEDHVHLLFCLSRTHDLAGVIKECKRSSSAWLKTKDGASKKFAWQSGYGAFSVSHSQADAVRKYIANQEEHHRKISFRDEYLEFLKKHEVPFDEKYVWE